MKLYKVFLAAGVLFLVGSFAGAENNSLAKLQTVPAGEGVANYLQAYLTTLSAIVETKKSGGLLGGTQTYRVVVVYDPDKKDLDISMVGMQQDPQTIQNMMGAIKKIVLGFNKKLEKNFGVTLQEKDLSMDYLYAKSGNILMRYRDGKYLESPRVGVTPAATPDESQDDD